MVVFSGHSSLCLSQYEAAVIEYNPTALAIYYYNRETSKCERKYPDYCAINVLKNRFPTEAECKNTCEGELIKRSLNNIIDSYKIAHSI